jgi:hypothetical protein
MLCNIYLIFINFQHGSRGPDENASNFNEGLRFNKDRKLRNLVGRTF